MSGRREWWRRVHRFWEQVTEVPRPVVARAVVPDELIRPDPRAAAQIAAARTALFREDLEACAAAAEAALALRPGEPLAAFYLGQARLRQQRFEAARQAFAAAVAAGDPFGLAAGWLARAEALLASEPPPGPRPETAAAIELERAARAALRKNDPAGALTLAETAIERDPDNLLAHHLRGQALLALGRRAEAIRAFEAARPHDGPLGLVDAWLAAAENPAGEPTPAIGDPT